jgi:hypothetical protein
MRVEKPAVTEGFEGVLNGMHTIIIHQDGMWRVYEWVGHYRVSYRHELARWWSSKN